MLFSNLFFIPPPQVLYFFKENLPAMRNFLRRKIFALQAVKSLRKTEVPRLPPGVESGCSGFFLPRWSLRASAFVGGWRPPRPNSLFPAGRGRTEKGLRWEEGAGNWWGRAVPAAAIGKAGIAAIRTGRVGDTAIATWACRFRGAHQDPFPPGTRAHLPAAARGKCTSR